MHYRPEIDGLRAIAVIPVMLFHTGSTAFSGGFLGVDVFFVISGYLITTLLCAEEEITRAELAKFITRRARRLLPALFCMVLATVPFAWMWMLPDQFNEFSRALISSVIFISNFVFWKETDYFANADEEKPLIHTWSLSVEWQFYLVFAAAFYFLAHFKKRRLFGIFVVVGILSFLFCDWSARNSPVANFYMFPTRLWEFLAGALVALVMQMHKIQPDGKISFLGLITLICSFFYFDEKTAWPGLWSMLPVASVCIIIMFTDPSKIAGRILGSRFLVGIGLISYSLYIWHQPILAFARIRSFGALDPFDIFFTFAVIILLSLISWRFIEKPFRDARNFPTHTFPILIGTTLFLSCTLAVTAHNNHLQPLSAKYMEKKSDWKDHDQCYFKGDEITVANSVLIEECLRDGDVVFLVGDSHAATLSKPLRKLLSQSNKRLVTFINNACLPIPEVTRVPIQQKCIDRKRYYWKLILETKAPVVMSARWRLNFSGQRFDNTEGGREYGSNRVQNKPINSDEDIYDFSSRFIQKTAQSNKVYLVGQIPEAGWHVPQMLIQKKLLGVEKPMPGIPLSTSYSAYLSANELTLQWLKILSSNGVTIIEPQKLVCGEAKSSRCLNELSGKSLYRDDDHPSELLASLIASKIYQSMSGLGDR